MERYSSSAVPLLRVMLLAAHSATLHRGAGHLKVSALLRLGCGRQGVVSGGRRVLAVDPVVASLLGRPFSRSSTSPPFRLLSGPHMRLLSQPRARAPLQADTTRGSGQHGRSDGGRDDSVRNLRIRYGGAAIVWTLLRPRHPAVMGDLVDHPQARSDAAGARESTTLPRYPVYPLGK